MTRLDEDPGKRRGKAKQFRGKRPSNDTATLIVRDFSWGDGCRQPKILIAPNPIKGGWTYPKPGYIQWRKTA